MDVAAVTPPRLGEPGGGYSQARRGVVPCAELPHDIPRFCRCRPIGERLINKLILLCPVASTTAAGSLSPLGRRERAVPADVHRRARCCDIDRRRWRPDR